MARAAIKERELKRENLVDRYQPKREALKNRLKTHYARMADTSNPPSDKELEVIFADIEEDQLKLDSLPRNASPKRKRNRCQLTGRPRGVYRRFKLCRNMIRKLAMSGLIPGVLKSSW